MKRTGFKTRGKPMQRKRKQAKQPKSATGPMEDPIYKAGVKGLPCCACGAPPPSDIHHCKDRPPADLSVYRFFPGFAQLSADYDGIPLCRACHWLYHNKKGEFRAAYGRDYTHIPTTRATLRPMEIDF